MGNHPRRGGWIESEVCNGSRSHLSLTPPLLCFLTTSGAYERDEIDEHAPIIAFPSSIS
jgi:hypothetical protein